MLNFQLANFMMKLAILPSSKSQVKQYYNKMADIKTKKENQLSNSIID